MSHLGHETVIARMMTGAVVGGVPEEDHLNCYLAFAHGMKALGRRTHLLTRDADTAANLFAGLSAASDGSVLIDLLRDPTDALAQADLYVTHVEAVACGFLHGTLHADEGEEPPDLDVALVHDPRTLLLESDGLAAILSADELPLLDRIGYSAFIAEYPQVSGCGAYLSDEDASEIGRRYGVQAFAGGEPPGAGRRGRFRLPRARARACGPRRDGVADHDFYAVENNQRQALVERRRELLASVETLDGIEGMILRGAGEAVNREQVHADLLTAVSDYGPTGVHARAAEVVRILMHQLWPEHLAALDRLLEDTWAKTSLELSLETYADRAYRLYADMLARQDVEFASYMTPLDVADQDITPHEG